MSTVERDPAGLLERVPELARLADAHVTLRRAIEHGRPHAAYRALFWIRVLGRAGQDAELVRQLLATRRLFIQPLKGAPAMLTYNGVGARVYGETEPDPADHSHIKTQYLVLFFVPVYPLASFLVRSATRGWNFYGRVPLSGACYLWQRAVALAGVVAVLIGALNAFGSMRYNTVQIVNALPRIVEARVGSAPPVMVWSQRTENVRVKVGLQDVVMKVDGRVIERGQIEVKRGYDVDAWNVLGAGPVFREDVVYTAKSSPAQSPAAEEPPLLCGEHTILQHRVDYVFTAAPPTLSMSENEGTAHRSRVALAELPPLFCIYKLHATGSPAQAEALASSIAAALDYDFDTVDRLIEFFVSHGDAKEATDLLTAGRARHDEMIEYQRLYQTQEIYHGRRAQLVQEFRERASAHPDSADDAYLLGRLLGGSEADHFVTESQARFPRHPYLLRSAAFRALWHGEYAEVERLVDELHSVDPKMWPEALDLELRALAASGKLDKARGLVNEALSSPRLENSSRFELVVDAQLLGNFEPKSATDGPLASLHGQSDAETGELRLAARVNACGLVMAEDLSSVQDKELRSRLDLEMKVRQSPDAALEQVASSGDSQQGVTPVSWALLLCEATRRDPNHPALKRLLNWSPHGPAGAAALIAYVEHGTTSDELEDFEPEVLAAADYVRSRAAAPGSKERKALRTRAAQEDMLRGPVSVAMNDWPE
jgi:hypothetical protein